MAGEHEDEHQELIDELVADTASQLAEGELPVAEEGLPELAEFPESTEPGAEFPEFAPGAPSFGEFPAGDGAFATAGDENALPDFGELAAGALPEGLPEGFPAGESDPLAGDLGPDLGTDLAADLTADLTGALPHLPLPVPAASDLPTFQLTLSAASAEQRAKLREKAEAAGVRLTDSAWSSGTPILSQLTEYQAVILSREARALGLQATARVSYPQAAPNEEDLALGDLAGIPDPVVASGEGAPSVALPAREREVLLFTGDALPGFRLVETRGPVTAHRSIARRLFREEESRAKMQREIDRVAGRPGAGADSQLQILFRALFLDLQKQALAAGANAVLSLRTETFRETEGLDPANQELRLLVMGTAAVVDKS